MAKLICPVVALGLAVSTPAAGQSVPQAEAGQPAADTLEYWTAERMRSAGPLPQGVTTLPPDGPSDAALPGSSSRGAGSAPAILPEDEGE